MFLILQDPDPDPLVRDIDLDLLDFLSLKNDINLPSKSNKQKNYFFQIFFVGVLKVNDENSRIQIRIRIRIH
jgi:hypothetical protein